MSATPGASSISVADSLIPVLIGAYGIPEVFNAIRKQERSIATAALALGIYLVQHG